jgi:hypothetical protein
LGGQSRGTANVITKSRPVMPSRPFLVSGEPNGKFVRALFFGAVVVIVTATGVGDVPLSVTELGVITHVDKAGAPLHVSATVCVEPFCGVIASA